MHASHVVFAVDAVTDAAHAHATRGLPVVLFAFAGANKGSLDSGLRDC